ncbi:hypothetical protein HFU84_03930 [Acidithiobacillus sp. CV18-2]|uniref:GyrI-like small molecule binding domain-containing protein n=1 Tax=Igneacidithiobacillus copahuensis TaxID=2724909 RepID=A0AAE2YMI7_9PROT|nr:hypothetical protein [Igneacidithiobacillus copahuensis]MBU2753088.1 hypothetical protein [Acidithiobacillus sp. CV18-3]MBU2756114.1 hypothetical protein [Acidithiobacillus sp. BN09-2]MBU2776664.1 hypothetical protein [Acidithiobacillus sp. CV18-2]MBU2797140.1 hypothetical protein [Acidithiobacillus sp. VAN18-2]MBU2799246.1 hypothetical protein [Acidithiobacillus sp. VAN18-4]UTV81511.1 hypothetical protein MQE22_02515 [Acidithiobacillus sp. YTS05]
METSERIRPKRDWRRGWGGPFLVFLAFVLFTLWWLGVFTSASVQEITSPALHYVYRQYDGSYAGLDRQREKWIKELPADWRQGSSLTLIEKESGMQGKDNRVEARLGVLLTASPSTLPKGWQEGQWTSQRVAAVDLQANSAIASWKGYAALHSWCKRNGITPRYPLVELLGPGDRYRLWMPLSTSSRP